MSKKKKRTGPGTGAGCLGLNVTDTVDCPFMNTVTIQQDCWADTHETCNINDGKDCEPHSCLLRKNKRVIVDWRK